MKVCILSAYFLETTFPLAKHLADNNIDITVYCLFHIENKNSYVVDFSDFDVSLGIDNRFNNIVYNNLLKEYLQKVQIHSFFASSIFKKPIKNIYYIVKLIQNIKKQNFDIIHFIGNNSFEYLIWFLLKNKINVHTLHEVSGHENNSTLNFIQRYILNFLYKSYIHIITHSKISHTRLSDFFEHLTGNSYKIKNRSYMIPFGLFETYGCFIENTHIEEENKTILFFGRILPYKGLSYLFEAFKMAKLKIPELRLIIAGEGKIDFNYHEISNIEVLNQNITNNLLVKIIRRCSIVVCPYISASQSGIPMVAYYFRKPIIATNVGGLPEVIENNVTGIIVPPENSYALAKAIEKIISDSELRNTFKLNIQNKYSSSEFSWQEIARKTLDVYKRARNI
jgi:glycosyltransferase involved in cell wall biosynthesis